MPNDADDHQTIRKTVHTAVDSYLRTMDDQEVTNLYEMVLAEVEASLLAGVMQHTGNNQSKTATLLGLSRGTLRTKLRKYRLL